MDLIKLKTELRELQNKLIWLENEVEGMRSQDDERKEELYIKITDLAKRHIIHQKNLKGSPKELKLQYIACLSHLSSIEKENFEQKLLFLTRRALGLNDQYDAESVVEYGLKFGQKGLGEALDGLKEWKFSLLLDALILANMCESKARSLSFVADMAYLLDISKDELRVISKVAGAVLEHNFDLLDSIDVKEEDIKWQGIFSHYIPEDWLIARRILCAEFENPDNSRILKILLEEGTYIPKGEQVVIKYEYVIDNTTQYTGLMGMTGMIEMLYTLKCEFPESGEDEFEAPQSGIWYYRKMEGKTKDDCYGYLISCFDDPKEAKEWMEKKHSNFK